jgi:ribonuclease T1
MSRRAKNWLPVLSTCWLLWTVSLYAGPAESQAQAAELAAASIDVPSTGLTEGQVAAPPTAIERTAPEKAYDLLQVLLRRKGQPLPGYVGGKVFHNRERQLPRGRYKEYDVNRRVPGYLRDAERLVIEQDTGKAYYTGDHYRTFLPLN